MGEPGFNPEAARHQEQLPPPETGEPTPETSRETAKIYAQRLRTGKVGVLLRMIQSEPGMAGVYDELVDDTKDFLSKLEPEAAPERVASAVNAIMRDEKMRELLLDAMFHNFEDFSARFKIDLREAVGRVERGEMDEKIKDAMVYDEVVIGGGIHAVIYNTRRTIDNPSIKSLTVEASGTISSNFRAKRMLRINSANAAHSTTVPAHRGSGNINTFGMRAPVQLPFIQSERFPTGSALADVATANQYLSNSDTVLGLRTKRVWRKEEVDGSEAWPTRYKVEFGDGTYVFTDRVIFATGIGRSKLVDDAFDEESRQLVEAAQQAEADGIPPDIMSYDQFGEFVEETDRPLRPFAGKKVTIVGPGDSGRTVSEFLLRLGDAKAYGHDVLQAADYPTVNWVGESAASQAEFLEKLAKEDSARYAQLAELISKTKGQEDPRKPLRPMAGRMEQVRLSDDPGKGKYKIILRRENAETKEVERVEVYSDIVILAAGYEQTMHEVLGVDKADLPTENPKTGAAVDTQGLRTPEDSEFAAVQMKDEEIFMIGAGASGQVVQDKLSVMRGTPVTRKQLVPSIGEWGPRSERFAQIISRRAPNTGEVAPIKELTRAEVKTSPGVMEIYSYPTRNLPVADLMIETHAKIGVAELFDSYVFPDLAGQELKVKFAKEGEEMKVSLSRSVSNRDQLVIDMLLHGTDNLISRMFKGIRTMRSVEYVLPIDHRGRVAVSSIATPSIERTRR